MVTVVVLAKNEAKQLAELLPQLTWANRVVVIDDHSVDDTVAVARSLGATCVTHALNNNFAAQRNFALSQISNGWVLFLDADERLSKTAERALLSLSLSTDPRDRTYGYQLLRQDVFCGRRLQHGEAGSIQLTRFAHVSAGVWIGAVHETWDIAIKKQLPGVISHYSHDTVSQLFRSVQGYAWLRSRELRQLGAQWSLFEQLVYPFAKFMKAIFVDHVFLDGWQGLLMAIAMSYHSWLVRWHLWTMDWQLRSWWMVAARYLMLMPWVLLPFGQLLRADTFGHAWYGFELFMGLAVVWSMFCGIVSKKSLRLFPELWLLAIWMGCSFAVSLIGHNNLVGGLYILRFLLYISYLVVFVDSLSAWFFVSIDGLMQYEAAGLLIGGFAQYILMPDMRWLKWFGWDDHYYRMIGLLFDPNFIAVMLLLIMVYLYGRLFGWKRYVMLGVLLLALVTTFSRTAWILGLLLGGVVGLTKKTGRLLVIGVAAAVMIWLVLPKPGGEGVNVFRSFSIATRIDSWATALKIWEQSPIIGVGYNRYSEYAGGIGQFGAPYHPTSPDSSWLLVLATMGIVGMCLFGWMWLVWWRRYTDTTTRMSLLIVGLHAGTNNTFFYPWVLLWLWLLFARYRQMKQ